LKIAKIIVETLGVICLTALIILTIAAVAARYFLNSPLAWGEEVQMICMIWAVMLGGIAAAWERVALAIDIVPNLAGPAGRRWLGRLGYLITALTMIPLVYYGCQLAIVGRNKITNILYIPYTYVNLAIPVGAAGIALISLIYVFTRPPAEKPAEDEPSGEGESPCC
jgi:TRAP-type C4-dicarboxylate transport system permease small subunit